VRSSTKDEHEHTRFTQHQEEEEVSQFTKAQSVVPTKRGTRGRRQRHTLTDYGWLIRLTRKQSLATGQHQHHQHHLLLLHLCLSHHTPHLISSRHRTPLNRSQTKPTKSRNPEQIPHPQQQPSHPLSRLVPIASHSLTIVTLTQLSCPARAGGQALPIPSHSFRSHPMLLKVILPCWLGLALPCPALPSPLQSNPVRHLINPQLDRGFPRAQHPTPNTQRLSNTGT
jgi:hypothetical protein